MRASARILRFAVLAVSASSLAGIEASADDVHPRALDTSIPASSMSAPAGGAGLQDKASADDLSARIDQLEANRAAAGQAKSPISLSVSGWISQEVTVTRK